MATISAKIRPARLRRDRGAFNALTRRALSDARVRTGGFAALFLLTAYSNPTGYSRTYTTVADRLAFAHSFAHNKAVVLFYGKAYDLLTVGGYSAWRTGGTLAILSAIFGLLAAVRALRTEEESGRAELVLSSPISRARWYCAVLCATGVSVVVLWSAVVAGSRLGHLPFRGSTYLALAIVSMVPVFVGLGALVSQVAPTRRLALELGGAVIGACFLLRVIADTANSLAWLRWVTPLGWAEELRPFTGAQPVVLVIPLGVSVLLLLVAWTVAQSRDVGNGMLAFRDAGQPRLVLLRSSLGQAFRAERVSLVVWLAGVGGLGLVMGVVSKSISSAGISPRLVHALDKLGVGSVLTPRGYIAFSFVFVMLLVSLFAVSQLAAARHQESGGRLESLLALPVSRFRWLGGRILLGALGTLAVACTTGLLTWAGAASQGVSLPLLRMLEAAVNCLPVGLLFLGLASLLYAALPRFSTGLSYGLVALLFLWQLMGSLLGVPHWLREATPFAHVGLVPVAPFRVQAAVVMLAVGLATSGAAIALFRRRDLSGA